MLRAQIPRTRTRAGLRPEALGRANNDGSCIDRKSQPPDRSIAPHDAQAGGAQLNLIGPGPMAANANVSKVATAGQGANLAWPALLRKLDRENPGYDS